MIVLDLWTDSKVESVVFLILLYVLLVFSIFKWFLSFLGGAGIDGSCYVSLFLTNSPFTKPVLYVYSSP